jgi:hypothetical protein
MAEYISEEDFKAIRDLHSEFTKINQHIGDIEFQKHKLLKQLEFISDEWAMKTKEMTAKYGDCTINVHTGEINKNKDGKN